MKYLIIICIFFGSFVSVQAYNYYPSYNHYSGYHHSYDDYYRQLLEERAERLRLERIRENIERQRIYEERLREYERQKYLNQLNYYNRSVIRERERTQALRDKYREIDRAQQTRELTGYRPGETYKYSYPTTYRSSSYGNNSYYKYSNTRDGGYIYIH